MQIYAILGNYERIRGVNLVPKVGVEPTRCRQRRILNPLRLPVPSLRRGLRIIKKIKPRCKEFLSTAAQQPHGEHSEDCGGHRGPDERRDPIDERERRHDLV